jgi:DNA-directed RNA polymerase
MNTTKQKLVDSLKARMAVELDSRAPVKFIRELDASDMVDAMTITLYTYTRGGKSSATEKKQVLMSEVITGTGNAIRNKNRLKKDSALSARSGAFILYSFESLGIIKTVMGKANNNHGTYQVQIVDEETLSELWEGVSIEKVEKLPSLVPYEPWVTSKHPSGANMVKTADRDVLTALTAETHPMVFECLNKAQRTAWNVNKDIYPTFNWALRNKADAFADIWEMQNPEAKASKVRESRAVAGIAKRLLDETFYHLYYYDFRGRKYPSTAYFHEQGTDAAKGLLLRHDKKRIGEQGFFWLLISIASNWAGDAGREDGYKTDKIPLNDRVHWALDNKEILLSYAQAPKINQGWMKADKPWQFLAACNEWMKAERWVNYTYEQAYGGANKGDRDIYDYESHLECFIDGSNNGSQHLSALTRDEVTAPHVNLVPSELPGDLYKYVGDHVWEKINKAAAQMPKQFFKDCEGVIDTITDMKNQIMIAPMKSDRRKTLIEEIVAFKKDKKEIISAASTVFWYRITDAKHRRKVVKRNVMTLPLIRRK